MNLAFAKYHGAGNDFVMIDAGASVFEADNEALVRNLCDRHFGIGADGLIIVRPAGDSDDVDFAMHYYNADGHTGSLCGNGARCAVGFAAHCGYATNETIRFRCGDGLFQARIGTGDNAEVSMPDVIGWKFTRGTLLADTGSPHYVVEVDELDNYDVNGVGQRIRWDVPYQPGGVNANFVRCTQDYTEMRTYERGVEAETLACGTGAVAAAIFTAIRSKKEGLIDVHIKALGGDLRVTGRIDDHTFTGIWLSGPFSKVYTGLIEI